MGKSKYQTNAQNSVNNKTAGRSRPQYYDEKIKSGPQSKSSISVKSLVFVIGLIAIVGGGIFGVGKLLDNQLNPEDTNLNPFYTENSGGSLEIVGESGYKMDISIVDIYGTTINLEDHAGKVVVLYFHFLECSPCGLNSPNLKSAMNTYDTSELLVISISVQPADTPAQLIDWATLGGYQWALVRDTDYSLSSRFGAAATPHMAFLGKDGTIEHKETGVKSVSELQTIIDGLL